MNLFGPFLIASSSMWIVFCAAYLGGPLAALGALPFAIVGAALAIAVTNGGDETD